MSIATATRKWLSSRPQPSQQAQEDRALIARESRKAELDDFRADCRSELERTDLTPARRESIHALLRESYRAEGLRDDLVFDGSKWVLKRD